MLAALEALSETALVFGVWILFPPEISLFLRNGMFIIPTFLALIFRLYRNRRAACSFDFRQLGYESVPMEDTGNDTNDTNDESTDQVGNDPNDAIADEIDPNGENDDADSLEIRKRKKRCCILNTILQVFGLLFQLVGVVLVCTFTGFVVRNTASVLIWIVLGGSVVLTLLLSTIWTGKVQKRLTIANDTNLSPQAKKLDPTARWKASKCMHAAIQMVI